MKLIFSSFLLICIFALVFGEDGCSYEGHLFKVGEKYEPLGECVSYTCIDNGSIGALGCPAIGAGPGCKIIPQDPSKPYPYCCEDVEC